MKDRRQAGFGGIEIVLIAVAIAIVGAVGYVAISRMGSKDNTEQATSYTQQTEKLDSAAKITTATELEAAQTSLNSVDLDDTSDADALASDGSF